MSKTLRLLMPQWQGGNNPCYVTGAKLLEWLAPVSKNAVQAEVPIEPHNGTPLPMENGVVGHSALLRQLDSATRIIESHEPDRIIVFGGDCLVSQAPFAYLNEKHGGNLGVLWLDAHPDVSTPDTYKHEHAMVLGSLLGAGDPAFAAKVKVRLNPDRVMLGGLQKMSPGEASEVSRLGLATVGSQELSEDSGRVLDWISENDIRHLAIHLDLDVLDPVSFRALLFAKPEGVTIDSPHGKMTLPQVARIIQDVSAKTEVVCLSIAEHLPWDAINIQNFFGSLPIFEAD